LSIERILVPFTDQSQGSPGPSGFSKFRVAGRPARAEIRCVSIFRTSRPRVPRDWREKVSGLREVAKCVASTGVQPARVRKRVHTQHAHTHAPENGDRRGTLGSEPVARTSTYEEGGERESDRKTRTSGTEVRGASFPSDMPGCLLVLSHRLRPTSLPLRAPAPRPFLNAHSLFSFFFTIFFYLIFIYFYF